MLALATSLNSSRALSDHRRRRLMQADAEDIDHGPRTVPASHLPRPWAEVPPDALQRVVGIMTDIDDTLTRDGAIEGSAFSALTRLRAAGIPVVAITGRPMGWSEGFARQWPLAAIVAENGAVALIPNDRGVEVEFAQDEDTRALNAAMLRASAERIVREVPGATLARDSSGRVTDIAIDHSEFEQLEPEAVARVVTLMRQQGMTATVSSIHINGWYGSHDKWRGACWMLRRLFARPLPREIGRWVYVGDSTNDQPMFERFSLSVGVANLRRFAHELDSWPAYITEGERGAGFAEVADAVLVAHAERSQPVDLALW
jgi:HAD superfamily hydrolase (TIGR01484 family)